MQLVVRNTFYDLGPSYMEQNLPRSKSCPGNYHTRQGEQPKDEARNTSEMNLQSFRAESCFPQWAKRARRNVAWFWSNMEFRSGTYDANFTTSHGYHKNLPKVWELMDFCPANKPPMIHTICFMPMRGFAWVHRIPGNMLLRDFCETIGHTMQSDMTLWWGDMQLARLDKSLQDYNLPAVVSFHVRRNTSKFRRVRISFHVATFSMQMKTSWSRPLVQRQIAFQLNCVPMQILMENIETLKSPKHMRLPTLNVKLVSDVAMTKAVCDICDNNYASTVCERCRRTACKSHGGICKLCTSNLCSICLGTARPKWYGGWQFKWRGQRARRITVHGFLSRNFM